jgi:hypothetical protein
VREVAGATKTKTMRLYIRSHARNESAFEGEEGKREDGGDPGILQYHGVVRC